MRLHGIYDIARRSCKSLPGRQIVGCFAVLSVLGMASCGDILSIPPRPSAAEDSQTRAAPFPTLQEVPSRPNFPNTLQARQSEMGQLAADMSAVRYNGDRARYEAGLLPSPPIARKPIPLPSPRPKESDSKKSERQSAAARYVTETVFRETNDGDLSDFLDSLEMSNLAVRRAGPRTPTKPTTSGTYPD